MLDEHTIRDGHLTPEALDTLARGACDERDTALLLCHLEACPACMDGYIEAACTAGTDEPAGGYPALESRILTAVTRESRRARGRIIAANIAKMSVAVALTMLLFQRRVPQAGRKHLPHPAAGHHRRSPPSRPRPGKPF